jgi:hypothetical protein
MKQRFRGTMVLMKDWWFVLVMHWKKTVGGKITEIERAAIGRPFYFCWEE